MVPPDYEALGTFDPIKLLNLNETDEINDFDAGIIGKAISKFELELVDKKNTLNDQTRIMMRNYPKTYQNSLVNSFSQNMDELREYMDQFEKIRAKIFT